MYLREDAVLDAVARFFGDRVFGPHRREILAADLDSVDDRAARQRQAERQRLQRVLADIARRQHSILRQAQDGDPDDPFTQGLRGSYKELEARKTVTLAAVAELDAADKAEPAGPAPQTPRCWTSCPTSRSTSPTPPNHCYGGSSRSPSSLFNCTTTTTR